ncbi:hypothetical protein SAMN05216278_0309 [Halopelagius longus]|uniref:Uncharacterized protein n=2 Tax=Halopelagius longus TaxID=1236180 RepID=A0A1H0Y002_9EURY|nr:hypothetical protein SAMN05216278_0309 [Halopelagius longus]
MCHHYESTGEWEALVRKELEARREESDDEEAEPEVERVEPEAPDVPTADD